jgi:hypothetical protein
MRLSTALIAILFCTGISTASHAESDADDIVILSVKPRSADVRPVIVLRSGPPVQDTARQDGKSRKAGTETLPAPPDNRAGQSI